MDNFPLSEQNDLVLTSSVNWSSNAKQIIENDEKDFDENNLLLTKSLHKSLSEATLPNTDHLNISWGNYFGRKSPPIGDLCGSHNGHQRPQFHHNDNYDIDIQKQSEFVSEKHEFHENQEHQKQFVINEPTEHKDQDQDQDQDDQMMATILEDGMEHEDVMININESLENMNLASFNDDYLSNRDSNSTQKTNQSTDSQKSSNKLIRVPRLKYTQRFYQFTINKEQFKDEQRIDAEIEEVISKYIESQNSIKAHISATTYNPQNNRCTVLILFDQKTTPNNDDEWVSSFLSFPHILKLMNQSQHPYFTEFSAK